MEIQELAKDLFQGKEVRILGTLEEPLFVANDIGAVLGLTNIRKSVHDFDDDEKVVTKGYTLGGNQEMILLTESGLYKLLCTSRKKEAKVFQKWVFRVIKEIRLKGRYDIREDISKQQLEQQLEESQAEVERLKLDYKPVITYHELDINDFTGQSCVYLFHLGGNDYKFGVSGEMNIRYETHMKSFAKAGCTPKLVNIWKCETSKIMRDTEMKIKILAKHNNILVTKYDKTEIISTDNINYVINRIDKYVAEQNSREISIIRNRERDSIIRERELIVRELELIREIAAINLESQKLSYVMNTPPPAVNNPPVINTPPAIVDELEDNIAESDEDIQEQRPVDKKQAARDWILNNPPKEKESTTDYYKRYTAGNNNVVKANIFGPIARKIIGREPIQGTGGIRRW